MKESEAWAILVELDEVTRKAIAVVVREAEHQSDWVSSMDGSWLEESVSETLSRLASRIEKAHA